MSLLCLFLLSCLAVSSFTSYHKPDKATLYIIGDSTVKNGSGTGEGGLWGWGDFISAYFDSTKLNVENHAIGGRSSRTFLTEGRWDKVLDKLQPGDFVLMQFGHNDGGPMATGRARASIKGNGDETQEVTLEATGKKEVVHSYGWYMRKYVREARAKGAIPIVLSPVPRNIWKDSKVVRAAEDYGKWAAEAAKAEGGYFIDLNEIVAQHYEKQKPEEVKANYFPGDHTHTNLAGAELNAAAVIEGLLANKEIPLNDYLVSDARKKVSAF
ncbi:rhamnogalacturonan acetylesterase [Pontibacter sp. 172403-2]|nr:rhamnogalacturonan acetylesterase [Pontibacter sp. 172403-2]